MFGCVIRKGTRQKIEISAAAEKIYFKTGRAAALYHIAMHHFLLPITI